MSPDALLNVMTGAVVVAAIALILQVLLLVGMYRTSMAARKQLTVIAGQVESFTQSAQRSLEQSRKHISEVATKTGEVLDLARKQLVRIDELMGDAASRARVQMDRAEMILDDTLDRLHAAAVLLNQGVLRPIREVNGVVAGVHAALGCLFRGRRLSVERATHDEEMFI